MVKRPALLAVFLIILSVYPGSQVFSQGYYYGDLSSGRVVGLGGEAFIPTLTGAYLSIRLWASDTLGIDGGYGAISIPLIVTLPSYLARGLVKVINDQATDAYLALGVSGVMLSWIPGGPVIAIDLATVNQYFINYMIGLGIEHSMSRTIAISGEADVVIGGGGFNIIAGLAFHFYR